MVLGVQVADGPALAAEDHRFGLRPEVVVDDAVQELSIGDARSGEGNVLTAHQVVDREDAAQVLVAGGTRFLVVAGPQPEAALEVTAQAFQRAGGEHRLRQPTNPEHHVDPRPLERRHDRGRDVAVAEERDPGADLAHMPTGARTSDPRSAVAMTDTALGRPFATRVEPSSGFSATSQASPLPSPTVWPSPSGADADSSPITMVPLRCTPVSASPMALAAVPRIPSRSRFPIQRPAERAAASVARTSSRPRFGWTVRGAVTPPEEGVETSDLTRFVRSCPLRSPASSAPPHRRAARRP